MHNISYPFELPALPYARDSLMPYITPETIDYHYGKHHQAYVTNLNNLVKDTPLQEQTLIEIIKASYNNPHQVAIFNNAAQIWNHTFYFHCMKPQGGGKLSPSPLLSKIEEDFGSFESMVLKFKAEAMAQFGSGWAWLVLDEATNKLSIVKTANADLPMPRNQKALMTIDVWEHAYYIDHRNARANYVNTFFDNLVNWEFAEKIFVD